jgi:hypothetical protein
MLCNTERRKPTREMRKADTSAVVVERGGGIGVFNTNSIKT